MSSRLLLLFSSVLSFVVGVIFTYAWLSLPSHPNTRQPPRLVDMLLRAPVCDDASVSLAMFDRVRVLCWVMTTGANHQTKAIHVQATWGRRCNRLVFVSDSDDVTGALKSPVVVVNVSTGRDHLTAKTMTAFDVIYRQYLDQADWFLKADDDTYVIMENLRYFLSTKNTTQPVYFGHHFQGRIKQGYNSGGAGYVLSRRALTLFARRPRDLCRQDGGDEDVELGRCMERLGVAVGDTGDSLGRSKFHMSTPEVHIHGEYPDWYWRWDKYGARQGIDSISDYAVSFHYVSPHAMYNLEFYVYHLRPYGVQFRSSDIELEQQH